MFPDFVESCLLDFGGLGFQHFLRTAAGCSLMASRFRSSQLSMRHRFACLRFERLVWRSGFAV